MYEQHGLSEHSWQADEEIRTLMKDVINTRINPFNYTGQNLVSIISGVEASSAVKADLEGAFNLGESKLEEFANTRLETQTTDFYAPIKANKSKTFSSLKTKPKASASKTMQCSGRLFDRLLVVSQQRQINMKEVMSYSLGEVSWSLSSPTGGLLKTMKSALMGAVEKDLREIGKSIGKKCYVEPEEITNLNALIVDGMAEIQSIRPPATFGEWADVLLRRLELMSHTYKCGRIDFVCDTYPTVSIKGSERDRRGLGGTQRVTLFGPAQRGPIKYQEFLAEGLNKEALTHFLHQHWCTIQLDSNLVVVIAYSNVCFQISYKVNEPTKVKQILNLSCDHEEADTRMLLHTQHIMSLVGPKVMIKCQDTDVFIIALAMSHLLPSEELYFFTGNKDLRRYFSIANASEMLTSPFCEALLGLHAISGCDSVSSFYGKGKKTFYQLFKKDTEARQAFWYLGDDFDVSTEITRQIEKFICKLYGVDTNNINEARYAVYCSPSKVGQHNLPPTKDELRLHINRANYQTAIWKNCLQNKIRAPAPENHGWLINQHDKQLKVQWMTQDPAPIAVLKVMFCKCKTGCSSNRCHCQKAGLKCTDLCQCSSCSNRRQQIDEGDDSEVSDYSDDSDNQDL